MIPDRLLLRLPDRQPRPELHEPDPEVRELIAANFANWTSAVRECLDQAGLRDGIHTQALAELVLTVMEGAVMQTRTYRDISHYDRAVAQLRDYLDCLRSVGAN